MRIRVEKNHKTRKLVAKIIQGFALGLLAYAFARNYKDLHRYIKIRNM